MQVLTTLSLPEENILGDSKAKGPVVRKDPVWSEHLSEKVNKHLEFSDTVYNYLPL